MRFELQPKQQQRDYDWLLLVVDRRRCQIRALTAADKQGGRSTFTFTNFKENVGLADKTFRVQDSTRCRCHQGWLTGADRRGAAPRRRSACWRCWSAAAPRVPRCRAGEQAEQAQDYDRAVVEYTAAVRREARRPQRAGRPRARAAARRRRSTSSPAAASRPRAVRRGGRRIPARVRAESDRRGWRTPPCARRGRACAPRSPSSRGGTHRAREPDRPHARSARRRASTCRPTPTLPDSLVFGNASSRGGVHRAGALRRTSTWSSIRRSATSRSRSICATTTLADALAVADRRHPHLLPRHRAAHGHDRSRHAGQAPRVRRGDRPHVLPEQRRRQGSHRPAARSSSTSGRSRRSRRPTPSRSRTRPSGSPRPARLIAAIDKARPEVVIDVELLEVDRTRLREYGLQIASPGSPGIDGSVDVNRTGSHARKTSRNLTAADVVPVRRPGPLLPAAEERHQHADAGQSAAAHVGRHHRAGALRRAGAGAGHDVRADRGRRHQPAADHVVQLREHRRQHRHHAAHAPRRRGVAGAEDGARAASPARASAACRPSATARSTRPSA